MLRFPRPPVLATGLLAAALALAQTGPMPPARTPEEAARPTDARSTVALPSVAPLVASVRRAVVNVEVVARAPGAPGLPPGMEEDPRGPFGSPFGPPQAPPQERLRRGQGSGFLIDPTGWLVTNHHVVEGATAIRVKLEDGRAFDAEVKGRDPLTDVALLKLKGSVSGLPSVPLGNSDAVQVGDWVVAIGNPFGLASSVSVGILSARARDIGAGPYDDFLQTDASINPGNSGGPLFNLRGEVIGMNTAIVGGGSGIGFSVPSNLIQALLPQLRKEGLVTRGYLGASLQDLTPPLARALGVPGKEGAIVAQVVPGSPAAKAGLRVEDIITALDGQPVKSGSALSRRVALLRPGSDVRLDLLRGGKPVQLRVKLGTRPDLEGLGLRSETGAQDTRQRFGLALSDVPPQLAQQAQLPAQGALITDVRPGSPAANAELQPGMVVVALGSTKVQSARELAAALERAKPGQSLLLRVRVPNSEVTFLRALVVP
ncbi:MAG TPA: Do family serine endopeptidase [Aggregicoccus sp.]|nr:Do family serine endopeptidase [Aggregicoccus sp.]